MLQGLVSLHPLVGVLDNKLLDEIHGLRRHGGREHHALHLAVDYLPHGLLATQVVERGLPSQQFESQDTKTPEINTPVVVLALENLRGCVVEGAAVGLPSLVAESCPAEVTQFVDVLIQKECTWEMTMF